MGEIIGSILVPILGIALSAGLVLLYRYGQEKNDSFIKGLVWVIGAILLILTAVESCNSSD